MPPLPSLEPAGSTAGFTRRKKTATEEGVEAEVDANAPKRPLNVLTSFYKGDESLGLSLKIKLPPTWDDKTVAEAVIKPFVEAYDKKFPETPASPQGPFLRVKVLVWSGPLLCAADKFRVEDRDGHEDIKEAEKPIHCLFDVDEPVSALRRRAHNKLKPTIEIELVKAESTALVLRSVPSTALLAPGEKLMGMLQDNTTDPEEMHALVDAAIAGGELSYLGLTTARDRSGKNPLHLSVTRGDATLCRKLLRRREDLFAMDSNRDMAIHMAAMAGRQIIVKDLLELGALVHEKNRDLMLPLNLAVVEEAQGNGEVVRMLIEHGADIDSKNWDVTPIMAACAGGHQWAIEVLLELGADINIRNGYEMMALDYCRDQDTAQLMYDAMRGFFLPSPQMVAEAAAWRERRAKNAQAAQGMPNMGMPGEDKGPRIFQAVRKMPLGAALDALGCSAEWLPEFQKDGTHYPQIRYRWRQAVLRFHPDRQPPGQSDEKAAETTAAYMKAMAAFESVEAYYATHFAEKAAAATSAATSPREPAGADTSTPADEAPAAAAKAAAAPAPEAAPPPVDVSDAAAPKEAGTKAAGTKEGKEEPSAAAKAATARAARPLLLKQRVEIMELQAKPEHNGKRGMAMFYDRDAGRYAVHLDNGEKLRVRERNMKLLPPEEGSVV